jgi:hypothetical protein
MFKTITTPAYHIGGGYYPASARFLAIMTQANWQIKDNTKIRLIN